MHSKKEYIELTIDSLLGINLRFIEALLRELEKLDIKQIRLIGNSVFPLSAERKRELKSIPEKSLARIEKTIKIYKAIEEAEEEGFYETAEHFSGMGIGLGLMTEEEINKEFKKAAEYQKGKQEEDGKNAAVIIGQLEKMFADGNVSSERGCVICGLPENFCTDGVLTIVNDYFNGEWLAEFKANTGNAHDFETSNSLVVKPDKK